MTSQLSQVPESQVPETGAADLYSEADSLFGGMPDGVLIQTDGRIVYANQPLAALLGVKDPAELVGMVGLALYPEAELASVIARLQTAYFGRPTPAKRHRICGPDGSPIEVEVSSLLLRLAGRRMLMEVLRVPS